MLAIIVFRTSFADLPEGLELSVDERRDMGCVVAVDTHCERVITMKRLGFGSECK